MAATESTLPNSGGGGSAGEPCSFQADTPVATTSGDRVIGRLDVGDHVEAYNPATGKNEAQTVQHVWLNHDHDRVDVRV